MLVSCRASETASYAFDFLETSTVSPRVGNFQRNVPFQTETRLTGWTVYNTTTCKTIDTGKYAVTVKPKFGTLRFAKTSGFLSPDTGKCAGKAAQFLTPFYTWTRKSPRGSTDTTTLRWSSLDERFDDTSTWSFTLGCEEDLELLVKEYVTYKQSYKPACNSFSRSASTKLFPFSSLNYTLNPNGGKYSYILLNKSAAGVTSEKIGFDAWITEIDKVDSFHEEHRITSAYRNPYKQWKIYDDLGKPQKPNGQHVYGTALDISNNSKSKSEYDMLVKAAKAAGASWIEDFYGKTGPCKSSCVHADWRYFPRSFVQ